MRNPIRRNRNIGTAKQGYGQENKLVIPYPAVEMKSFYERLGKYKIVKRVINQHEFRFVVEETRDNSFHACSIDDIEEIIVHIPKENYGELGLIVLRQPTRKEENLNSVWGRLIYSFEFENDFHPAIIIEAVDLGRKLKWPKKLDIDSQKELERLKNDGHEIMITKKHHVAEYFLENIRSTQLYRTLLHEFGHYVHYLEIVKKPLFELKKRLDKVSSEIDDTDTTKTNELFDIWDKLDDEFNDELRKLENVYFAIPSNEKERFAHSYSEKMKMKLESEGVIPFDQKLDDQKIQNEGLNINDFKK